MAHKGVDKYAGECWGALCFSCCMIFVLFVIQRVEGAFEFHPVGAQAGGVGDVGVAHLVGAEGMFWNPASVGFGQRMAVFVSQDRPFGLAALENQALALAVRWRRHGLGVTYEGFGFDLYREQVMSGVYGVRVANRLGVGIRVRRLVLQAKGFERRYWMVFDLGVRGQVTEDVGWGATARNVSGVRTGILGQGGSFGVVIRVSETAQMMTSVQKEAGMPTGFVLGVANTVASVLTVRVGIGSQPERFSGGWGLDCGWFCVDYAGSWHSVLGLSHRLSLRLER